MGDNLKCTLVAGCGFQSKLLLDNAPLGFQQLGCVLHIHIDDGLPFVQAAGYGAIDVDVVWLTDAGYETVRAFEPVKLYKWALCEVEVDGLPVSANVLVPAQRLSSHAEHLTGRWVSAQDPLLLTGLVAVRELAVETVAAHPASASHSVVQDAAFWVAYMRTEAAYLLLWSVLERYATLRYGPALDPERKIALLGADQVFRHCAVAAAGVTVGRKVKDTRGAKGPGATKADGSNAGKYFRQIRNNIAHRGKAAYNETDAGLPVPGHVAFGPRWKGGCESERDVRGGALTM